MTCFVQMAEVLHTEKKLVQEPGVEMPGFLKSGASVPMTVLLLDDRRFLVDFRFIQNDPAQFRYQDGMPQVTG